MLNGLGLGKVVITQNEMQKFTQKMQSDPKFSERVRKILQSGDFTKLAEFLRKNGFKLG